MIVAGHRQDTAMRRRADEIAAVQGVAGAVHAGPFAVPHAEHAIDSLAGEGVKLLRAVQHRGGEVLVDPWLEPDVVRGEHRLAAPEFLIHAAQRRAAIARHQRTGVQPCGAVEP